MKIFHYISIGNRTMCELMILHCRISTEIAIRNGIDNRGLLKDSNVGLLVKAVTDSDITK